MSRVIDDAAGVVLRFSREPTPRVRVFHCAHCGRRIGGYAPHYVRIDLAVVCVRCEARYVVLGSGTRAGVARFLWRQETAG
jgi:hypothetical protein